MAYFPGFLHVRTPGHYIFCTCFFVLFMYGCDGDGYCVYLSVGSPSKPLQTGLTGSLAEPKSGVTAEDKELEEFETPSGGSTADGVESGGGADTEEEGQDKLMRVRRMVKDH